MTMPHGPLLDALRGVRWPARRAVGAALPGTHRSRQRGTSGEFTEYRLYRQGDDPRQLDWKLLARSDRAFVRLTDDRALLPTWVILDGSASMNFPDARHRTTNVPDKWSAACAIAIGLASIAHASADPVGLLCTSATGTRRLSPRSRRGTIAEIVRTLGGAEAGGSAPLAPLLDMLSPNARIVIITDLLGDGEELVTAAAHLAAAGAMLECVHVIAAEELAPASGAHLARDPESPQIERVLNRNALASYLDSFAEFRASMARRWRAMGAGYTEARTDASLPRIVRQVVGGQES
ncbi:MAG: DUF58 domain-containing protein [Gemmatimonas sp.]